MKTTGILRYVTIWTALGAIAFLALLLAIWGVLLRSLASPAVQSEPTAVVKFITAPTSTPIIQATLAPTATATLSGSGQLSTPGANEQIKIGDYVQITGTGGDGLRIRSGAGTDNPPLFLGMESEVFQVIDGPKDADGFKWWNLAAPYDDTRKGWAASNYLLVIAKRP
jgi:hypothetical protein